MGIPSLGKPCLHTGLLCMLDVLPSNHLQQTLNTSTWTVCFGYSSGHWIFLIGLSTGWMPSDLNFFNYFTRIHPLVLWQVGLSCKPRFMTTIQLVLSSIEAEKTDQRPAQVLKGNEKRRQPLNWEKNNLTTEKKVFNKRWNNTQNFRDDNTTKTHQGIHQLHFIYLW